MTRITSPYNSPGKPSSRKEAAEESPAACIVFSAFGRDRYSTEEHPDGELLRESGEPRIISLTGDHQLPLKLALVHEGKITPSAFAAEYGLLGDDMLAIATHRWHRGADGAVIPAETRRGADRLSWFMQQAADVFRVLCLLESLDEKDVEKIKKAFVPLEVALKNKNLLKDVDAIVGGVEDPIELARHEIVRLIQPHLEGINRELVMTADGFRSRFKARALVDVVYWTLADLAQKVSEGSSFVRHCKECKTLYIADDPRRLFCSKKCGNRHGVRSWRTEQQKESKGRKREGDPRKGRKS